MAVEGYVYYLLVLIRIPARPYNILYLSNRLLSQFNKTAMFLFILDRFAIGRTKNFLTS